MESKKTRRDFLTKAGIAAAAAGVAGVAAGAAEQPAKRGHAAAAATGKAFRQMGKEDFNRFFEDVMEVADDPKSKVSAMDLLQKHNVHLGLSPKVAAKFAPLLKAPRSGFHIPHNCNPCGACSACAICGELNAGFAAVSSATIWHILDLTAVAKA